MTAIAKSTISGFGGMQIDIHQVTLSSGTITLKSTITQPKFVSIALANGQTAATEGFTWALSAGVITITSSNASSVLKVDVLVMGY
jgi:hypothetical protein